MYVCLIFKIAFSYNSHIFNNLKNSIWKESDMYFIVFWESPSIREILNHLFYQHGNKIKQELSSHKIPVFSKQESSVLEKLT